MVGRTRSEGSGKLNAELLGRWGGGQETRYSNVWQHVCHDRTNPGPPYKAGGSLYIEKVDCFHYPSSSVALENSLWGIYNGGFICGNVEPNWYWGGSLPGGDHFGDHNAGKHIAKNDEPLDSLGATGWNRAKPGQPIVDLGQFIGELRNAPSVPGKSMLRSVRQVLEDGRNASKLLKGSADEYLNYQFGWKPIVNDLRKMLNFQQELHRKLAQLKRDNGKPIRRSVVLNEDEEVLSNTIGQTQANPFYPYVHPFYHVNGTGKSGSKVTATRKDWFEARFRYFIPDIEAPDWPDSARAALLGINPTPGLLWELLPWSWLIDWFVNVGDVLDNMSQGAAENLVADYAYVMSHVQYKTDVVQESTLLTSQGEQHLRARALYSKELKRRSYASPFGFGLTPANLSGRQKAILGALGISRTF